LDEWKKIGDAKDVAGTYRIFEFDVTSALKPGSANAIALEILRQRKMIWALLGGLESDSCRQGHGHLEGSFVGDDGAGGDPASVYQLEAGFQLQSGGTRSQRGAAQRFRESRQRHACGRCRWQRAEQEVELAAGETRVVRFGAEKFPQLKLAAPKLWWPFTIGTPYLYTAKFSFEANGAVSDSASIKFGVRESRVS